MIVGNRILTVLVDGVEHPVAIKIHLPKPDGQYWDCHYEIDWPEGKIESFAGGNDAIAALHAAINKIGMELYMSRYHHERTMWWLKPWVGYGFPLPKGARDELIGDDQRFYGLDPRQDEPG